MRSSQHEAAMRIELLHGLVHNFQEPNKEVLFWEDEYSTNILVYML